MKSLKKVLIEMGATNIKRSNEPGMFYTYELNGKQHNVKIQSVKEFKDSLKENN